MRKVNNFLLLLFLFGVCFYSLGCNTATRTENLTLEQQTRWKKFLKTTNAKRTDPINTTVRHISNVSHEIAVAKINQALQSYNGDSWFKLSTVYALGESSASEGEGVRRQVKHGDHVDEELVVPRPMVTEAVVQGHLYLIGFLDYAKDTPVYTNRGAYEQTSRIIPAIAVCDGEDAEKPAWIRTADEDGKPYKITLHLTEQSASSGGDPKYIYTFLRNKGFYSNTSNYSIDNPAPEFDEKWRPFFVSTYNLTEKTNAAFIEYPEKLLIVDMQTEALDALNLDNPNTFDKDERDSRIDKDYAWVDQCYSKRVVKQWIRAWGANPKNYQVASHLDEFELDHDYLGEVMNYSDTNIVFVGYIVSTLKDDSLIGIMTVDPRHGTAIFHDMQGDDGMASKSSAEHAIMGAVNSSRNSKGGGSALMIEDLTVHTIYGVHTWVGALTLQAYDNAGEPYGSFYFGTVLFLANYDHQPAHVVWATTRHAAYLSYQKSLILRRTNREGSNVLKIEEISGTVRSINNVVVDGQTVFILHLVGRDDTFEVPIDYIGNPLNSDVLGVIPGHTVYLKYGDIQNSKIHFVQEIRDSSQEREQANQGSAHQ